MSKADEMFEKLGYENIINEMCLCEYRKYFNLKGARHIIFAIDKTVSVCEENNKTLAVNRDYFTMQELQAINEKCKELGWISNDKIRDVKEYIQQLESENKQLKNKEQKVKEKLEELKKEYREALENNSTKAFILKCQIEILEEIMKGEE